MRSTRRVTGMTDQAEVVRAIVCTKCGCDIDYCSFCDEEDCAAACCYGCLVVDLRESAPAIHPHGG
jgi:hypothetical protein